MSIIKGLETERHKIDEIYEKRHIEKRPYAVENVSNPFQSTVSSQCSRYWERLEISENRRNLKKRSILTFYTETCIELQIAYYIEIHPMHVYDVGSYVEIAQHIEIAYSWVEM